MNELRDRKIRFSNAAHAIGATTKKLRHWLQRIAATVEEDKRTSGWAEFTLIDIAVFAVMQPLIRWGLSIEQAHDVAKNAIWKGAAPLLQYHSTPADAFTAFLHDAHLLVWNIDDEDGPNANVLHGAPDRPIAGVFLTVRLKEVVEPAFARLNSSDDAAQLLAALNDLHDTMKGDTNETRERLKDSPS